MDQSGLADFLDSVCRDSHLRIEDDFGDGFVRLRASEAERRQAAHDIRSTEDAVIELLRNSRDAHASNIFLAVSREGDTRRLAVIDDGDGIPASMHARVFEPRVTSKLDSVHMDKWGVHGRGMALYSITVNSTRAEVVCSLPGLGCAIVVETDLKSLPERTDQSSFPSFELTENGSYAMRGPKNIVRTACEFALESRRSCSVYWGSATEIAASLYEYGMSSTTPASRTFIENIDAMPVCKRLCTAFDPADFATIAHSLGLSLSERSARRIMDGDISPVPSLTELIREKRLAVIGETNEPASKLKPRSAKSSDDARGLRLAPADVENIKGQVKDLFQDIARSYYLEGSVEPELRVSGDAIRITIPVRKLR